MDRAMIRQRGRLVLLCIILMISVSQGAIVQADQNDFQGAGTEENPYLIESAEQLFLLGETHQNYVGRYFRQTVNIDLSGYAGGEGWKPIGREEDDVFQAIYDGGGFNITGLAINRPDDSKIGLFGVIGESAVVKNIHISGEAVIGYYDVGALAGDNYGQIINVSSNILIEGLGYLGGLVGENYGSIINSFAYANVNGSSGTVGGLIGYNDGGFVKDSYVIGTGNSECITDAECDVSGSGTVGGLIGSNYDGTIINSYSTASVYGTGSNVGGLIGSSSGEVIRSHASGDVLSSDWYTGGLIGINSGVIRHSYATGEVLTTGSRFAGGLVGQSEEGEIHWSYATGKVTGGQDVGGLVGQNRNSNIIRSYANGQVMGKANVGGLIGTNLGTVELSYATGNVSRIPEGTNTFGGLIGSHDGILKNAYATGQVMGSITGGLLGSTTDAVTEYAYASGPVLDGAGISGWITSGVFKKVYWNMTSSGTEKYVEMNVSGEEHDIHGLNAEEMMDPENFIEWDFINVWEIKPGELGPTLRTVDIQAWYDLVSSAKDILLDAQIGEGMGEYPISAKLLFEAEIETAEQIFYKSDILQSELDAATVRLHAAIDTFQAAVNLNDVKLVFAETFFEGDDVIILTFDRPAVNNGSMGTEGFIISDPGVSITSVRHGEEAQSIIIDLDGSFSSAMPTITVLPGAVYSDGLTNDLSSTVRIVTQVAIAQLLDEMLAEAPGDTITIQHIIRYMSKPGADLNGNGKVDVYDIDFMFRYIDPLTE